jgi:hypothetical protein
VLSALTLVLLSAEPVSLAMPGLSAVNITPAEAEFYGETLAGDLIQLKLKVSSARDIATALGVERQRELLGCTESGCFAELAGALGADGIVAGDVGKIGEEYVLDVKVLKPDGSVLALFNAHVDKAEHVRDALGEAARSLVHQLAVAMHRPELEPPVVVAPPPKTDLRLYAIAPGALGVVGLGLGAILQVAAGDKYTALTQAMDLPTANSAYNSGKGLELGGNVALAVGTVALVAAVVWFFIAGPQEASP